MYLKSSWKTLFWEKLTCCQEKSFEKHPAFLVLKCTCIHLRDQLECQYCFKGRNSLEGKRQKGVLFVVGDSVLTSARTSFGRNSYLNNFMMIQKSYKCDYSEWMLWNEWMISGDIWECLNRPLRSWTKVRKMHLLIDTDKLLSNTWTCEHKQFYFFVHFYCFRQKRQNASFDLHWQVVSHYLNMRT